MPRQFISALGRVGTGITATATMAMGVTDTGAMGTAIIVADGGMAATGDMEATVDIAAGGGTVEAGIASPDLG